MRGDRMRAHLQLKVAQAPHPSASRELLKLLEPAAGAYDGPLVEGRSYDLAGLGHPAWVFS